MNFEIEELIKTSLAVLYICIILNLNQNCNGNFMQYSFSSMYILSYCLPSGLKLLKLFDLNISFLDCFFVFQNKSLDAAAFNPLEGTDHSGAKC